MAKIDIFSKVDKKDKSQVLQKAASAALGLQIIYTIAFVFLLLFVCMASYAYLFYDSINFYDIPNFNSLILILFILFFVMNAFLIFYTHNIRKKLKSNRVPSLIFPYIFAIIYAVTSIIGLFRDIELSSLFITVLILFLWYVLISNITYAKRIEKNINSIDIIDEDIY